MWISVETAMPNECVDVLCLYVTRGAAQQKVMCINADGEWQGYDDLRPRGEEVTHWMPLPNAQVTSRPSSGD